MGYIKNVHYSVDAKCYDCLDGRVSFGENREHENNGWTLNIQKMLYDGEVIGLEETRVHPNVFIGDGVRTSFILFVNDGVTIDSAHFVEDEWDYMAFSSLQECIDWYLENKDLVNTSL